MPEIIDLKEKILSKLEQAQHILQKASELGLTDDFQAKYRNYCNDVKQQGELVDKLELKMALVAPMSSGKSTVVNAIIAQDLLPVCAVAMTAICTDIVFDPHAQEPELFIDPDFEAFFRKQVYELQNKINLLGPEGVGNVMSRHPHLEDLKNEVQSSPNSIISQLFDAKVGTEKIGRALYHFNHIVRLSQIIDSANGLSLMQEINQLKRLRIKTPYLQEYLSENCQGIGNLVIIDTPGPNEKDISSMWDTILPVLSSCSAILVLLDYTQIGDESSEKVKEQVQQLSKLKGAENLYVLVNKIDQRMPGDSMTKENIKTLVLNEYGVKEGKVNNIFEVSGRQAFCAAKYTQEIKRKPQLDKSQLKTAEELATQVFSPLSWEDELKEATITDLNKKAKKLWQKSGFNSFIEEAINALLANVAPNIFRGALNTTRNRLTEVKQDFDVILASIDTDKDRLESEIKALEDDLELIKTRSVIWKEKIDEILNTHLWQEVQGILNDLVRIRNEVDKEIENTMKAIGLTKVSKFDNQTEAESIAIQVSQHIQEVSSKELTRILIRIDDLIKETKNRLTRITNELLNPQEISQIIQNRLQQRLDINIIFNFDQFTPNMEIDQTRLKMDDVKVYVSIFGVLHNTLTWPLRKVNVDIPLVGNTYEINYKTYTQQVKQTIQNAVDELTIDFKSLTFEVIPRQADEYTQKLQNQVKNFQRIMEESIQLKMQQALRLEPRKQDFSFLSSNANDLLTDIKFLTDENEKLL